jgi:hypothetical protein
MNVTTIIFSKDRPLQLHGTLESFRLHCQEAASIPISVVYCASAAEFEEGYRLLRREFEGSLLIDWIEEKDFKRDVLDALSETFPKGGGLFGWIIAGKRRPRYEHVLFQVDDNIFVKKFSMQQIISALAESPESLGFSLRIGRNTGYCYSNSCHQAFPHFSPAEEGILEFTWPGCQGDFGYPIEVSSSVYRVRELLSLLQNIPYSNPNRLEQGLSVSSRLFARKQPKLLCFEQSVAFCIPVNKVQNILDNRAGSSDEYSSVALNRMFLDGFRIDVRSLSGFTPEAAHQEITLPLIRG